MKITHQSWLRVAEIIDVLRVFPRVFLGICLAWAIALNYELIRWYMHLPHAERGFEATGFASVTFTVVMGFLKLVYQTYTDAGRDWSRQPAPLVDPNKGGI